MALIRQRPLGSGGGSGELPAGEVLAAGQRAVALAIDGARIYWVNQIGVNGETGNWEVRSMPKGGGAVVTLGSGIGTATEVTVDDAFAYVGIRRRPAFPGDAYYHVLKVPKAGGAALEVGPGSSQIAFDATNVYVSAADFNDITGQERSYSKAGGPATVLATNQGLYSLGLAVDDSYVYFEHVPFDRDVSGYEIRRVPKAGGPVTTLAGPGSIFPGRMVLTSGYLYFRDYMGVSRLPTAGGPVQQLRTSGTFSSARPDLDSDGSQVYWTEGWYPLLIGARPSCLGRMNSDGCSPLEKYFESTPLDSTEKCSMPACPRALAIFFRS